MHVGHLRSASSARRFAGCWSSARNRHPRQSYRRLGNQFGKLIWAHKRLLDPAASRAMRSRNSNASTSSAIPPRGRPGRAERAQQELVNSRPTIRRTWALWRHIGEVSVAAFKTFTSSSASGSTSPSREFLQRQAGASTRAGRLQPGYGKRGGAGRLSSGASPLQDAAVHHPEIRRRGQLCDD